MFDGDPVLFERGEHLCLATEAGQPIRIVGDGRQQDFDRDVAIQLRIARAIHLAHAADAED